MKDLWDTIKRSNLWVMGIKGEQVQTKGIENIFDKLVAENLPRSWERQGSQATKACRNSNRQDQKRTPTCQTIIKILGIENKIEYWNFKREMPSYL
jgi:hypothetical protein